MAQNEEFLPEEELLNEKVISESEIEEEIETIEEECFDAVKKAEAERDEWKDKTYRLAAEMENVKRRNQKEVDDARKYSITNIAKELVDVKDNLDRALDIMKKGDKSSTEDSIKAMLEGIQMVEKQITTSCDKLKITKVVSIGEKANPEFHQVMMEVEDEKVEQGIIVQEMQSGYMIGERLLRPALVTTAK